MDVVFALSDKVVEKKKISISLIGVYVEALDRLVEAGVYESRGEAIQDALRTLFRGFEIPPFSAKKKAEEL